MEKITAIRASKIVVGGAGLFVVAFFTTGAWMARNIEISLWNAYITGLFLGIFLSVGVIVIKEGIRGE